MKQTMVLAGGYSEPLLQGDGRVVPGKGEGVYAFALDESSGALARFGAGEGKPNPSYMALHSSGRLLYTVNELKEYAGLPGSSVSAYALDNRGGMRLLGRQPTGGEDACHVMVDEAHGYAFVSNFSGGSVCVLPVGEDGGLGRPSCFLQHKGSGRDPERQKSPHPHQCVVDPTGRRVLVPDLGTDEILIYEMDWEKGYLLPGRFPGIRIAPGLGPRHCLFDAAGSNLYVLCELANRVLVYDYRAETGETALRQELSSLPEGCGVPTISAALKLHPGGQYLVASNRGYDCLAIYRVREDGLLALRDILPSGGETPRDFAFSPSGRYLIAANQDSNNLVVFAFEEGCLREVHREEAVYTATTVLAMETEA